MNRRQMRLIAAAEECDRAARQIEADFPRSKLDDPMIDAMQADIIRIRQADVASLRLAASTLMVLVEDADGYALLIELRAKKRWAFDALVKLARDELARADDAPGGELAA